MKMLQIISYFLDFLRKKRIALTLWNNQDVLVGSKIFRKSEHTWEQLATCDKSSVSLGLQLTLSKIIVQSSTGRSSSGGFAGRKTTLLGSLSAIADCETRLTEVHNNL